MAGTEGYWRSELPCPAALNHTVFDSRERERERGTDRQTDRQTETEIDRQTDRYRKTVTERN